MTQNKVPKYKAVSSNLDFDKKNFHIQTPDH